MSSHPTNARVNGVMTIIRADFPGFETARLIETLTVMDRYIVVRVLVNEAPLYIHNVYAPVDSSERKPFSTISTLNYSSRKHLIWYLVI